MIRIFLQCGWLSGSGFPVQPAALQRQRMPGEPLVRRRDTQGAEALLPGRSSPAAHYDPAAVPEYRNFRGPGPGTGPKTESVGSSYRS